MDTDMQTNAQRLLREYGKVAEDECDARISYYEMLGHGGESAMWREIKEAVVRLRDQSSEAQT
jgi:hypothetical protein